MLDFTVETAKKAGIYLRENFGKDLELQYKGRIDLVTGIDRGSQGMVVDAITRFFPGHSVVAEEGVSLEKGGEYTWYVDPLDGTVNYVHKIPFFCVSLAVYRNSKPFIGVCYNPVSGQLFHAQAGKGAYCNGERVTVSGSSRLVESLVATGFPYSLAGLEDSMRRFSRILSEARGIRRFGSAALDLCFVASGSFDGFWEVGLKPWDMAAGVVILLEAGGTVSGLDGSEFDLGRGDILASNGRIHQALTELM